MNHGQVQVVSGAGDKEVLAELGPGAVFGEIRYSSPICELFKLKIILLMCVWSIPCERAQC